MKKHLISICISLLIMVGIGSSVYAYPVDAGFVFDGVDLDTGTVEYDRTVLVIVMGDTIEEILRPDQEYLADFSPSVDVSFDFDPAQGSLVDLVLQDDVQIALLEDTSFGTVDSIMPGEFEFTSDPYSLSIDSDDLVLAWTAEDRYFKIGDFQWSNWALQFEVDDVNIVPEPSTFLLLGLGVVGVVALVKRKKNIVAMLTFVLLASLWSPQIVNAQPNSGIIITKAGDGDGTIMAGDQVCDLACVEMTVPYVDHRALVLKVIPDDDSYFVRWETTDGNSSEETLSVQPGDVVTAVFDRKFGSAAVFDYDFWNETFSIPPRKLTSIPIETTFSTDADISPFAAGEPMYGAALNADIQLEHEASLVRVVLVDDQAREYLIYEAYPLITPSSSVSVRKTCEETWFTDAVTPSSIKIQVIDASITIHDLPIDDTPKGVSSDTADSLRQQINEAQEAIKIQTLNKRIAQKGLLWRAGETPISQLSYTEKNGLFEGDELPNLQGFEYYKGGLFELRFAAATASDAPQSASPGPGKPVEAFDWRNRHGENWMSPVTSQGYCGSCWAFGATGATEASVNLYFNQHLDLNLAEQDALSCGSAGGCKGGNYVRTLDYYTTDGVVDEACFPYTAVDANGCNFGKCGLTPSPCSDKCTNPAELIRISGKVALGSSGYPRSEDSLKKMVINYGPVSASISSWWHVMTVAGYGTIHEGDVIYNGGAHDAPITIPAKHASIGKTYWIFKNSWGTGWGDNGYGNVSVDFSNISAYAIQTPIISATPRQIRCVDNDNDGYYNWGISASKPASCPSSAQPEKDCDDTDPNVGPFGACGQCVLTPVNLTDLSPQAKWGSGRLAQDGHSMWDFQTLPWMGAENDRRGFVRLTRSTLEDGSNRLTLRMHPMWVSRGTIKGWHPWVQLSGKSIFFRAQIGFLYGAGYTDGATFMVWEHHREGGREVWNLIASTTKGYTGSLETIVADLSHLAGKEVGIELRVDAGESSGQDWAAWINPQILFGSANQCLPSPLGLTDLSPRAKWASGRLGANGHNMLDFQTLPWMGAENDSRGFVRLTHSTLEDGSNRLALRMHPMWVDEGTIKGWHPWVRLSGKTIFFKADIGFLYGARYTDGATFMVWEHHREGGREVWNLIASTTKGYTGSLETIMGDLSHLAGKEVGIELRVDAGESSGQDWAAWINPQILFVH